MKEIIMTWNDFEEAVKDLAEQIKQSKIIVDSIYGVPRGGLVVAVRLSHLLGLPLVDRLRLKLHTLVVDDIVDTGKTLHNEHKIWKVASLFWMPKASFEPEFWYMRKPNPNYWVVFPWESE